MRAVLLQVTKMPLAITIDKSAFIRDKVYSLLSYEKASITRLPSYVLRPTSYIFLCDCHFLIKVNILNRLQYLDAFFHWPLKCFASADQSHATGSFIDYGCCNGLCQIVCAGRGAA